MKTLYIIYKTRLIVLFFLFYILGLWLEGPSSSVVVRSYMFILTFVFLSSYSSIYFFLKLSKYRITTVLINTFISGCFLIFVRVRYNGAILENTDLILYLFLSVLFLQFMILFRKV